MPRTTRKTTAPAVPLLDRITAQLSDYSAHVAAKRALAEWKREAFALRSSAPAETIAERATVGGPLPLDLIRATIASEAEAAAINRLRGELRNLDRLLSIYRLPEDEAAQASALLQDELDALMAHVRALDAEHELPASADEAMQAGPEAVALWTQLLEAVEAYDEIRRTHLHFVRLEAFSDDNHGGVTRFYRVGQYREQLDLDRAWINRRHEAGALHLSTSDAATVQYNKWLRPAPEALADAWPLVGGETPWPCSDRVEYLLWLARHTTPFTPTLDVVNRLHRHAEVATMPIDPDRVEAAEANRDAYWRLVGVKPRVQYRNGTAAQQVAQSLGYETRYA